MASICIIIPIYNVEKYIHRCIECVLTQTFTDFELILVDDGSPDNCGEICDEYSQKDNRIHVIHKENGGLSDARNAGMDYFIFIGANSTIMPGVMLADYTVVGAGSVVTHSTEQPGLVIAGNPARVVCTVEEYINKNSNKIVNLDGMSIGDIRAYIDQNPDKLLKRSSLKIEK